MSKDKERTKRLDSTELTLPKDFEWRVLQKLLDDLGFTGSCSLDGSTPSVGDDSFRQELRGAVRNRSVEKLLELAANLTPRSMCEVFGTGAKDAYTFFAHYQAASLLKKYPFPGSKQKRKDAALASFFSAEDSCRLFNTENFRALLKLNDSHPDFFGVVDELKADIRKLLGEEPNIDCIIGHAKHGPGVSLGDSYKEGCSTSFYKWSSLPYTVTENALPLAKQAISADQRWIGALDDWYRRQHKIPIGQPISVDHMWSCIFEIVAGSRTTTVPKSALTDRTIAIEPLFNVYLQLGVDYLIRRRLKQRWHYDINDQEANQKLAAEAAISGEFATLDLRSASEMIALMLCALLLPEAWYALLLDLRSPVTTVDGVTVTYEKISSMGNGFTFALETVIFGAITRCAIRRTGSTRRSCVYGDDIIVPTTAAGKTVELLNLCGFKLNLDKSFQIGPFRESCGSDYFLGYNVRPVFLKNKVRSIMDLFYLHNSLFILEKRLHWAWSVRFSGTLTFIRQHIPKKFRSYVGPVRESLDTHLFEEGRILPRNSHGQRCFKTISAVAVVYNPKRRDAYDSFYFRKLMCSLREKVPVNSWDRRRKLDTGNSFDITRRDRVRYVERVVAVP